MEKGHSNFSLSITASILSIALLYLTSIFAPNFVLYIFLVILIYWSFRPVNEGYLLLFPSIAPFFVVNIPNLSSITIIPIFVLWFVILLIVKGASEIKINKYLLPKYAIIGVLWILISELISVLIYSEQYIEINYLLTRIIRTFIFILALIFSCDTKNLPLIGSGWIIYGVLSIFGALVIQLGFGSPLAIRGGVTFGIGSIENVSAMILNVAYVSIASMWFLIWYLMKNKKNIGLFIIVPFFALASFYSGRRQALLSIILSVLIYLILAIKRKSLTKIIIVFFVMIIFVTPQAREFILGRESLIDEVKNPEKGTGYAYIDAAGWRAFLDSPFIGIGLGNYERQTERMGVIREGVPIAAHNSFIRILAETGIMGGMGLLILIIGFLVNFIKAGKDILSKKNLEYFSYIFPLSGIVLTGMLVTILDQPDYIYLFGQMVGMLSVIEHYK
jgi:O-antigen ligase